MYVPGYYCAKVLGSCESYFKEKIALQIKIIQQFVQMQIEQTKERSSSNKYLESLHFALCLRTHRLHY